MTSKQMRRMFYYESSCYIGLSILICWIIGYPVIQWSITQISEKEVRVNSIPMIGMIVCIIMIAWITVNVAYKEMLRLTPIERLQASE